MAARDLSGKKALVVGLGDTGLSCVRWLQRQGAAVRASDSRANPPHAERLRNEFAEVSLTLGGFAAIDFDWAELVVVSPGVPLATPQIQAAMAAGKDIVGDVELFARAMQETDAKVIAITGSNGKSTVTSMAGAMCAQAGLATCVAGNIGLPVLDALLEIEDGVRPMPEAFVLELSSFQLETTRSLRPAAATVLNISEDHMDRYADLAAYAGAKARILLHAGVQVLNRDDPATLALALPTGRVWTFGLDAPRGEGAWGLRSVNGETWLAHGDQLLMPTAELQVAGRHNAANALAALALCQALAVPEAAALEALRQFKGLAHRVEFVAEIGGVRYYDDSKGTNVGATEAALKGFERPVLLIAGGDGKGQDFSPLKAAVAGARAVVLIGRDAPLIGQAIAGAAPIHPAASMDEAVAICHALARPGDAVLLSPACASFDMFRNYAHRAEVFVAAVRDLAEQQEGADVP